MPTRFVHAADLHVDSPLRGLVRYEGAPVDAVRSATRRALANLVDLCISEEVDFLLLCGDVFDGDWRDWSSGLAFAAEMNRLARAGVDVVSVRGNHDAASRLTKRVRLPANVRELDTAAPQTVVLDELGVAIHGQGFARRAEERDLAAGYPAARPGLFNIGLLHTSLDGRPGHDPYAPTSVDVLRSKGYDYWALGHVHAREIVCRDPWIVYPGNLQGRHARETGPKGATLVTVDDDGQATLEPRWLDVVRWERVDVDAADATDRDELVERTLRALRRSVEDAEGRLVAARVVVRGATPVHVELTRDEAAFENDVRAASLELGPDVVWIERLELETEAPFDRAALFERDDPIGRFARSLDALAHDADALRELAPELEAVAKKLPAEARRGDDGVRFDEAEELARIVRAVERRVLPRLLMVEDE